ncbi:ataxin-2-like isoform X1 [Polyodon spathula]|uniref:ataxin-2-like isoform X1 n=1 Tax=Polyodon spathula TaxID=7913 RepID=UPI001B7E36BD|nr:ataxin-2-like isoform X1 [Polyodon spathula]
MLKQQLSVGGRKAPNGTVPTAGSTSSASPGGSSRSAAGRGRNSGKGPPQSSPVFEGVYNNSRMLHFLTAVVGSTCDIRVKNGNIYEGIFKTLSSKCELAVDAVHKKPPEQVSPGGVGVPPKREDIVDTMIFKPADVVTMQFKNVDLNYAAKDKFTDSAISGSKVNGEHKEKVLQRWEGGDSNGESYDLESDAANGWDPNEMFRYNEENYGIKSTYDSSLSLYTVPLEKGTSEQFRQREARAAKLASEIESSPQYRQRVSVENDEGRSEEDKYSSVVRERDRDRDSPRDRDRDSPSLSSSREGKYTPLPQRARESGVVRGCLRGSSGGGSQSLRGALGSRTVGSMSTLPPRSGSAHPSTDSSGQSQPRGGSSLTETSLATRGSYSGHHLHHASGFQSHHAEPRGSLHPPSTDMATSPSLHGSAVESGGASPLSVAGGTSGLPPLSVATQALPRAITEPMAPQSTGQPQSNQLSTGSSAGSPAGQEQQRVLNGGASRMSPKSQRIASRTIKPTPSPTGTATSAGVARASFPPRSLKSGSTQDSPLTPPYLDNTPVSTVTSKPFGPSPTPTFNVDVNEIISSGVKDRTLDSPGNGIDTTKPCVKAPTEHHRNQLEELRKFGKEFRLQSSGGAVDPEPVSKDVGSGSADPNQQRDSSGSSVESLPVQAVDQRQQSGLSEPQAESSADRQSPGTPAAARTPSESEERPEGLPDQVKKSTLNPNAKEFNPNKSVLPVSKQTSTPTPPRPQTLPSPSITVLPPQNQGGIYNTPYISNVYQFHMGPAVQGHQMYQYTVSAVSQGKYQRAKGSVGPQRSDQHHTASAPPMMQAATAAGPPLVAASPYPSSYIQYPQQYPGQQAVMQAIQHYQSQPMYPMLQGGNPRMMTSGGHPQTLVSSSTPQYPSADQGPPQAMYATVPQPYPHHSTPLHPHQPQPATTPTGNQQGSQHPAPSPVQHQPGLGSGQPPQQGLYHTGALTPTPPSITPGPNSQSPQSGYSQQQVYAIHTQLQHGYPGLGQLAQAHVQGALSQGHPHPHPTGSHGHPQVMLIHAPPQQGHGAPPNHPGQGGQQSGTHYTYMHQVPVQPVPTQQLSFHPPGN